LIVSAIYETGVRDIDKVRMFLHLRTARSVLGKAFGASFLQVSLFDNNRAPQDARRMIDITQHHVSEWQRREKVWLDVFKILRISSALTVSVIILISGLGMFSVLAIIVMEKTKEIAILRSMGFQRRDISHIFLWQGFVITTAGTFSGWVLGFLMTLGLANLPIRIRGIFSTDHFVVNWAISHYLVAALIAFVVVMLASYFPARRAARLEPADVIRGTSG
jgi:lipoprotein-releasing system permease protein